VKLQFVENSRIDNPSHGCQQRFSVERPRCAPAERILSRIHKPDSFQAEAFSDLVGGVWLF
jgi:hypothetical protein